MLDAATQYENNFLCLEWFSFCIIAIYLWYRGQKLSTYVYSFQETLWIILHLQPAFAIFIFEHKFHIPSNCYLFLQIKSTLICNIVLFVLLKGIIEYWGICNELWQQLASGFFLATLFSKSFHTLDSYSKMDTSYFFKYRELSCAGKIINAVPHLCGFGLFTCKCGILELVELLEQSLLQEFWINHNT